VNTDGERARSATKHFLKISPRAPNFTEGEMRNYYFDNNDIGDLMMNETCSNFMVRGKFGVDSLTPKQAIGVIAITTISLLLANMFGHHLE
jgi:hypothetical protein